MRVLITQPLLPGPTQRLGNLCDVTVAKTRGGLSHEQLVRRARGMDGVLCMLTNAIDGPLMDALPHVRIFSNYAVGYDNVDVPAATQRGVLITNTPGVLTETTADLAFTLLLSTARRVVESDTFLRRGRWKRWEPTFMLGTDVHRKTLGIVGMGRIGRAVAARARGFDMRVLCANRSRVPASVLRKHRAEQVTLKRLLKESDFVSIHVPLGPKTRHMFGTAQFRAMKSTAFLINTARGPIVDEGALLQALRRGDIAGAGLDVFEHEPQVTTGLTDLPNVTLLPHLGSATLETRTKMADLAVENLLAFAAGRKPPYCVNPEAWGGRQSGTTDNH